MPSTSPARSVERDAADGVHDAVLGREVHAQIVDLSSGSRPAPAGSRAPTRPRSCRRLDLDAFCRGSNASRRPSPMKLTDSEISTMNRPGNQNSHGSVSRLVLVLVDDQPERRVRGLTPRPRNDSAASSSTASAIVSVAFTMITSDRVRQDVPEDDARGRSRPSARAASTNSFSRSESTTPRMIAGDRQSSERGERQDQRHRSQLLLICRAARSCCGPARRPRPAAGRSGSGRSAGISAVVHPTAQVAGERARAPRRCTVDSAATTSAICSEYRVPAHDRGEHVVADPVGAERVVPAIGGYAWPSTGSRRSRWSRWPAPRKREQRSAARTAPARPSRPGAAGSGAGRCATACGPRCRRTRAPGSGPAGSVHAAWCQCRQSRRILGSSTRVQRCPRSG